MISYQEEKFENVIQEAIPLLQKHWEELANNKEQRPLDPDFQKYTELNRAGIIRILTVRKDGKLIGYASFVIAPNLHYRSWVMAVSDIYFLDPKFRGTKVSVQMFMAAEKWLHSLQVRSITFQDKIHHSHEKFFTKLGYRLIEQHYEKVL